MVLRIDWSELPPFAPSCFRALLPLILASSVAAGVIPAGTTFEVRLNTPVHSYTSKSGESLTATFTTPMVFGGQVLVPPESKLRGRLAEVRSVGWGFKPYAVVRLEFDQLEFPDGTIRPVSTRLLVVDNARERVDEKGRVLGIRATSAMGFKLAGITRNIFIWDPLIQVVLAASTMATLRFPEAEIQFPAGTELIMALAEDLEVDRDWPWSVPAFSSNSQESLELRTMVRGLTWRTVTDKSLRPADVTNLILVGEPEWVERAFDAAGWVHADRLTKKTGWNTFRAVAENSPYPNAPMSGMLLDERPAQFRFSKALNNYSNRHHLRIWALEERWKGRPVHTAASTQDVAITFSFSLRRTIHVIDRNVDNERAKVVNDLVYTGCVDAAELLDRGWVPHSLKGSNGGVMETDGAVAVLELNPCRDPQLIDKEEIPGAARPGFWKRTPRNFFLTIGNDFTYNNPVVQAVKGVKLLWNRSRKNEVWPTFPRDTHIERTIQAAPSPPETVPE